MAKRIFLFVILIRALAAITITNAHYTGVYPSDLIANGGLLGDVLFFSVSGFCLASTSGGFGQWYLKRFLRIYIPTWVITIFYLGIGAYTISNFGRVFYTFLWPTHWHFIASIILLYIPLFYVSKYIEFNHKNYWLIAISLFIVQLIVYLCFYDYSYYHIDTVREPMIEFIFFQSMLLGLYYRWRCEHNDEINNRISYKEVLSGIFMLILYFLSKMLFISLPGAAPFQIVNQIILWGSLYVLFDILMKLEKQLVKISDGLFWRCVSFVSERTLEIYLVQYVIIANCKYGTFPLNWFILTITILVLSSILHIISQRIIKLL